MKDCLVVVDVQNGFIFDKTQYVVPKIEDLIKKRKFDYIISTKFINERNGPFHVFLNYNRMLTIKDQELFSSAIRNSSDIILEKKGYSCFNDNFLNFIKKHKIEKLYFVGVDIDACVMKSAFDCFEQGIDFSIIVDCCATSGGEAIYEMSIAIMQRSLGKKQLTNSEEVIGV